MFGGPYRLLMTIQRPISYDMRYYYHCVEIIHTKQVQNLDHVC